VATQKIDEYTGNSGLVEVRQTVDQVVFVAHGTERRSLSRGQDYQCRAHQIELKPVSQTMGGGVPMIGGALIRKGGTVVLTRATDRSLIARVKSSSVGIGQILVIPVPILESHDTWWRWQARKSAD
jgi:hypothetical protein